MADAPHGTGRLPGCRIPAHGNGKTVAAHTSALALMTGRGDKVVVAPTLRTARANARRLHPKR